MNNLNQSSFSTLVVEDGQLVRVGSGPLKLPPLTAGLVLRMLTDESHGDTHPSALFLELTPAEKIEIAEICQQHPDLAALHRQVALDWAPITTDKARWDGPMTPACYIAYPKIGYYDEIQVLVSGQRLVRTGAIWRSFAEFQREFGSNPLFGMLDDLECDAKRIQDIVNTLAGRVVTRRLTVVINDKVESRDFSGLETQPSSAWLLPRGVTFMSEG